MDDFFQLGWIRFGHDPAVASWGRAAAPVALATLDDRKLRDQWLRCGDTWFAGVNALPSDGSGAIPSAGVPPLAGAPVDYIANRVGLTGFAWDRAQVSICFPGYPKPWDGESDAAFRFRRDRDAAHLDGLKRDTARRRRPGERHGFILGLPLCDSPSGAAPFVIYEGSHEIMRRALTARLSGIAPENWNREDVTDTYSEARSEVFAACRRVEIHARPGEAYLAHRLSVHGVAPWRAGPDGQRMIAYFRPDPFPDIVSDWWLTRP